METPQSIVLDTALQDTQTNASQMYGGMAQIWLYIRIIQDP